jgi:hypothetical protein
MSLANEPLGWWLDEIVMAGGWMSLHYNHACFIHPSVIVYIFVFLCYIYDVYCSMFYLCSNSTYACF